MQKRKARKCVREELVEGWACEEASTIIGVRGGEVGEVGGVRWEEWRKQLQYERRRGVEEFGKQRGELGEIGEE